MIHIMKKHHLSSIKYIFKHRTHEKSLYNNTYGKLQKSSREKKTICLEWNVLAEEQLCRCCHHAALPCSHTVWGEQLLSLDLAWLWSTVWWLEADQCQEDHQWLSPREMSSIGQFHMRGSAPGSEWRWAGSTQYPGFINHPAKAYRQTPLRPLLDNPLDYTEPAKCQPKSESWCR